MPRPLRIEYEGAIYHVMSRGNNGGDIFFDDDGRRLFLKTLKETCERTGWEVHAWVLMGNHYHLLIRTPKANLVAGMKWLQGTYTQRTNARMSRRGHLFQGRYKAQLVSSQFVKEGYFQQVAEYIHLNPARAGMIHQKKGSKWNKLAEYPWSSFPLYLGWKNKRPKWLHVEDVLSSYCLKDNTHGRQTYGKHLEARVLEVQKKEVGTAYAELRRGWCLGDGDFKQKMLDKVEVLTSSLKKESVSGGAVQAHGESQAKTMLTQGLKLLEMKEKDLKRLPKGLAEKMALAAWVTSKTSVKSAWLVENLAMGHISRITAAKRAYEENKVVKKIVNKLEANYDS